MFVKWMAYLSTTAFFGTALWILYSVVSENNGSFNSIILLVVSGVLWAIFMPRYQIRKEEEEGRALSKAMGILFKMELEEIKDESKKES